jgi:YHS domain-containing protein
MKKYIPIVLVVGVLGLFLAVVGHRAQRGTASPPPSGLAAPATTTSTAPPPPTGGVTIGPEEASCPVLGTVAKKSQMIPMQHNGKTYYLCCQECQDKFRADPEKYINNPAPPTREMLH